MIRCDSAQGSSTLLSEKTRMPVQPAASLHCATSISRSRYCSCGMRLDGGQVENTSIEASDFIVVLLLDDDFERLNCLMSGCEHPRKIRVRTRARGSRSSSGRPDPR